MSDGGIPPIEITLSVDAANAAQGVSDFVKEAKTQIERGYTDAVDKAQRKLDELNRAQKVHQEVIAQTGHKIDELSKKQQTASQSDQANIDQEIKKLQALIQTRQLDLVAIDAKKAKVEEQGLLSLSTNEAERQALQNVTQGRLVELGALRDQMKAIAGVRDTSAATAAQIKSDLNALTGQQNQLNQTIAAHSQRIEQLQNESATASASAKAMNEQEIANLGKAIQARRSEINEIEAKRVKLEEAQQLMSSTSEEERHKIQQATQARLAEIATLQDSAKARAGIRDVQGEAAAEAKSQIDSLTRKQQEHNATIDADKKKIDELRAKRSSASDECKKQIEQEMDSLRKIIANRQQEVLEIESKKIKLEETVALSSASTESEKSAIQKITTERIVQNNVIRDQQKAQGAVNSATDSGTSAVGNYIMSFASFGGIIGIMRTLQTVLKGQREEIEKAVEAGAKIRDLQGGEFGKMSTFFNEAQLYDADSQETGKKAIESIAKDNNLTVDTVAQTAADLSPVLGLRMISTKQNPERFADIVGNVARFRNRGLETGVMDNLVGQMLKDNQGMTGADINQELSNILALTGSAKRANALLQIYDEQQTKFEGANFSFNDVKKVYEALEANNISPEGIPVASKNFFQAMDRLIGLSPEEKESKLMELGDRGLSPLMPFFATDQPVDIKGLATAIDDLPKDQQEQAARMIGGPRNVVAAIAASTWTHGRAEVPDFPLMPKPSHPIELNKVIHEQTEIAKQAIEAPDPSKTDFTESLSLEQDRIARHPELSLPWHQRGWSKAIGDKLIPGTPNDKELAAISLYGKRLLRQARLLNDIDSGKTKATPQQRQALLDSMSEMREAIDSTKDGRWDDPNQNLTDLLKGGEDTARVLGGIKNDDEFLRDNSSHIDKMIHVADDRTGGPVFDRANRIFNELTGEKTPVSQPMQPLGPTAPAPKAPAPSTQPSSPVSVNYNNRIVNYGYGYDSIGAMQEHPNNFG